MRILYTVTVLVLISSLFSCGGTSDVSGRIDRLGVQVVVPEDPAQGEPINYDELVEEFEVLPLKGNEAGYITQIAKFLYNDKLMYFHDEVQHKIFIYRRTGEFLNSVEEGSAPNNASEIKDFCLDKNDNMWILSYGALLKYDLEGNFVGEYKIEEYTKSKFSPRSINISGDKFYLWAGSFGYETPALLATPPISMMSAVIKDGQLVYNDHFFTTKRKVLENNRFAVLGDEIFMTSFLGNDTIYSFNENHFQARYAIDFGQHAYRNYSKIDDYSVSEGTTRYDIMKTTNLCGYLYDPVVSSSHLIFGYIGPPEKPFEAIVDRKSLHIKTGRIKLGETFPSRFLGQMDDKIVAYLVSDHLVTYFPKVDTSKTLRFVGKRNWETLAAITKDDNPVLLIYKLKSF